MTDEKRIDELEKELKDIKNYNLKSKSKAIGLLLGFLGFIGLFGLGHLYAKQKKGFVYLGIFGIVYAVSMFLILSNMSYGLSSAAETLLLWIAIIVLINTAAGYGATLAYNDGLRKGLRK